MPTTHEAGGRLGIKSRSVVKAIKEGLIKAEKRGRDYWIEDEEIERYARERRAAHRPKKERDMTPTTEEIAARIFDGCIALLAYDPDLDTLAKAREINNDNGWTIERSVDDQVRGNVLRIEGVQVSDEQLVAAHTLALSWL